MKICFFKAAVFNCKQATLLSLKKEEGKISVIEKVKLFSHLFFCNSCKRFIKQSSLINHVAKGIIDSLFINPPHRLPAENKEIMQQQIDALDQ